MYTTYNVVAIESRNILIAIVPANCTDRLQPLDVSVSKPVKDFLRSKVQSWYSDQICSSLKGDEYEPTVDLQMSVVKSLGAQWLIEMYDYMKSRPDIISNGFRDAGIII